MEKGGPKKGEGVRGQEPPDSAPATLALNGRGSLGDSWVSTED